VTTPVTDIQLPDLGAVVELYDIDCTAIFGIVLRFTPAPLIADPSLPNPQPVVWQTNTYAPRACQSTGWQWDGLGPLPQPKLSLSNTDNSIGALCIAYHDLQGAIVTRHRVPFKYLDGMPGADPGVEFDPDIYVIDQKTLQNKMMVEFSLGAAIDVAGRLIPGRQVIQGYCPFRYRSWNGSAFVYNQGLAACPYTGGNYFDVNGNVVIDPSLDQCGKRMLTGCKPRFPTGDLPGGFFPGVARF